MTSETDKINSNFLAYDFLQDELKQCGKQSKTQEKEMDKLQKNFIYRLRGAPGQI